VRPVATRPDLYLSRPIRLEPTACPTFKVRVPWFPEGMWVVDIPEGPWGPFPGANDWPHKPEHVWRTPWRVSENHTRLEYSRREGGRSLSVTVTAEGDLVRCRIEARGIGAISIGDVCVKTLSPHFSSQERLTQHRIDDGRLVPVSGLPLDPACAASLGWTAGDGLPRGAVVMRALEGEGFFGLVGAEGSSAGGNGWPHCTHLRGRASVRDGAREMALVFAFCDENDLVRRLGDISRALAAPV
jgi:hypothetical protein